MYFVVDSYRGDNIKVQEMSPEGRKAYGLVLESLGLEPSEVPVPDPATVAVKEGLVSVLKCIENVKSASYTKGEGEIKIDIVIKLPPKPLPPTLTRAGGII